MKSTGLVRKIDDLGRIVLPMDLRKKMDLQNGDSLEIFVDGDKLVLTKYKRTCMFCDNAPDADMIYYSGKLICRECLEKLKSQF